MIIDMIFAFLYMIFALLLALGIIIIATNSTNMLGNKDYEATIKTLQDLNYDLRKYLKLSIERQIEVEGKLEEVGKRLEKINKSY